MKLYTLDPHTAAEHFRGDYIRFLRLKPLKCDLCGQTAFPQTYSAISQPRGTEDLVNVCASCAKEQEINHNETSHYNQQR